MPIAQRINPNGAELDVIGDLAHGLRGDLRDARRVRRERVRSRRKRVIEVELAAMVSRSRRSASRRAARCGTVAAVAQEREHVLVAAPPLHLARVREPAVPCVCPSRSRPDVGERDVPDDRPVAHHSPSQAGTGRRCRRGARLRRGVSALRGASTFRHREERRVPVDLAVGGSNSAPPVARARRRVMSADRTTQIDIAFVAAVGVDVARVLHRHLGVRRVQGCRRCLWASPCFASG